MPEPIDETIPVPPRYWWLKRILIASAILLLGLVALRLWWGWYADRQLQAEIDRIVAAGEPIYPEDFDPKELIPDDQNAAYHYELAINQLTSVTTKGVDIGTYTDDPTLIEKEMENVSELLEANAASLQAVRVAQALLYVDWNWPISMRATPNYSAHREMVRLLFVAAHYDFHMDDHGAFVDHIHDMISYGDSLCDYPTVISLLVGWACTGLGSSPIEDFGAQLQITDDTDGSTNRAADRSKVRQIITVLSDERRPRTALARAFQGDLAASLDHLRTNGVASWAPSTGKMDIEIARLLSPATILDMRREIDVVRLTVVATQASDWSSVQSIFASQAEPSLISNLSRPVTRSHWGDSESRNLRTLQFFWKYLAHRRMAAAALAIRLYEYDHGKRPSELSDLVPLYLSASPLDPFAPANSLLGYVPDGDLPRLYSVGRDGVDNGGTIGLGPDGLRDFNKSDELFYLSGRPKSRNQAASTSAETDEEDHESDDNTGEHDEGKDAEGEPE